MKDSLINKVVFRWVGPDKPGIVSEDNHLSPYCEPVESGKHRRIAGGLSGDDAVRVDRGHTRVVRAEQGQRGDVAGRTVGIGRGHPQVGCSARPVKLHRRLRHLDSGDTGHVTHIISRTSGNPFPQCLIKLAVAIEEFAARVRDLAGRFEQQQALFWDRRVHAAARHFLNDPTVVASRIVAEQR